MKCFSVIGNNHPDKIIWRSEGMQLNLEKKSHGIKTGLTEIHIRTYRKLSIFLYQNFSFSLDSNDCFGSLLSWIKYFSPQGQYTALKTPLKTFLRDQALKYLD